LLVGTAAATISAQISGDDVRRGINCQVASGTADAAGIECIAALAAET